MEKRERNKITNLESLILGNCNITLTLDTRYKDENGKFHASIRPSIRRTLEFLRKMESVVLGIT